MKVFISWSGARSRAVAELFDTWLRCVIQAIRPWISTRDIDRGALWMGEINEQLKDTMVGIVCLTQENKDRPWILFEAGALAKGLPTNRVCTFLIDLKSTDLVDPLAQFNHTDSGKDSMRSLVRTLNSCLGSQAMELRIIDDVFDTYWPKFESEFASILKKHKASETLPSRPESEMLAELLDTTRQLSSRMKNIERSIPSTAEDVSFELAPLQKSVVASMKAAKISNQKILQNLEFEGAPPSVIAAATLYLRRLDESRP